MKQLALIILVISSLSAFAQVSAGSERAKAITFVDTMLIKDTNNYPMNMYSSLNVVDLEDEGYFIFNAYDDMSGELKFLVTKMNVYGIHQFDTIYTFDVLYNATSPKTVAKIGNKSLIRFSNAEFKQPFVFALDNVSGNYLWSKSYEIDTTFRFFSNALTVNETTSEAVFCGTSSPSLSSGIKESSSFAIKIDGDGNEQWAKSIVFPSPDSNRFFIESVVPTEDGGYIFAASGFTEFNHQSFFSLIKLDSTGNKVWENNFNLISQPGKDTIYLVDPKTVNKVIAFNDGSASLIGTYMEKQNMEKKFIVAVNFNQATGSINHSKKLYLPNITFNLLHVVKDKEYNGIALNLNDSRDFNNPSNRLVKLDKNGNFRSSHQVIESSNNTSASENDALINTEDNGFLTVKKHIDSLENYRGYFITKLDKNLYSSCVDTVSEQFNFEDINTYQVNISSTISARNVTTKNNTLTASAPANVSSGISCKCQLSISGNVKDNQNAAVNNTTVYLYRVKKSGAFTLFDSTNTNGNGGYQFEYLPEEKFIIKANTNIPNTVNTYYGDFDSQPSWDSAFVLNLSCANQELTNKDIRLIPTVPQTGTGVIRGYVYELAGYGNNSEKGHYNIEKAMGDPIPGIDITLNQKPGGTVGSKITDSRGAYEFTGLSLGASYTLKADIPGLPNDSVYSIDVRPGKDSFDSLNFYVDSSGVYVYDSSVTGITVLNYNNIEVELTPNPTKNNVHLLFKEVNDTEIFVRILNNTGTLLIERREFINRGNQDIEVGLNHLANGVYFIQIQFDNNVIVKKIVKQ